MATTFRHGRADKREGADLYANQPEFFVSEAGVPTNIPPFVDTGAIAANNFNLFGAEGGLRLGSFYMQSEAIYAVVNQIGAPTVAFSGAYAYAGYFLTGEVRPYKRTNGDPANGDSDADILAWRGQIDF